MTGHDGVQSEDLQRGFEQLGIRGGDALFFHSSLRSFGRVNGGAETVIDSGVSAVGLEGTVAVPTFVQRVDGKRASYRQRAQAWDIHASPSDVGFITEMFCKRSDSVRSDHCCVSVAAIGAGALEAISGHRDSVAIAIFLFQEQCFNLGCVHFEPCNSRLRFTVTIRAGVDHGLDPLFRTGRRVDRCVLVYWSCKQLLG